LASKGKHFKNVPKTPITTSTHKNPYKIGFQRETFKNLPKTLITTFTHKSLQNFPWERKYFKSLPKTLITTYTHISLQNFASKGNKLQVPIQSSLEIPYFTTPNAIPV